MDAIPAKELWKLVQKKLFTLKSGTVAMSAILTPAIPCKDLQNLQVLLLSAHDVRDFPGIPKYEPAELRIVHLLKTYSYVAQ